MDAISQPLIPPGFVPLHGSRAQLVRGSSRVWPLAAVNGRPPIVVDARRADLRGVELAYPRFGITDAIACCPIGTPNGTISHLMPPMTAALAIDGGEITFAGALGHGFGITINHGNGWASHYAHLQAVVAIRTDLYRPSEQHVRRGDVIGYVGSPAPGAFKLLHFELWKRDGDHRFVPVDPRPHLTDWTLLQHLDAFMPPAARTEVA